MNLETDRLIIRRFTVHDLERIYDLVYGDEGVKRFWSGREGTAEEIKQAFKSEHVDQEGDYVHHAIVIKETDEVVGLMGFQLLSPAEGDAIPYLLSEEEPDRKVGQNPERPDVGTAYAFGRAYWKKGYATEAGRAMIDYAFERMGVGRIVEGVMKENVSSINLMRRLGFRIEKGLGGGVVGVLEREDVVS